MRFEWDEDKNRRNVTKHKISFETAKLVFGDQNALSLVDRVVNGDERWQTLGMVDRIVLLVAHKWTDEAGHEVIRIISARKAIPSERRDYAKNRQRSN